MRSAVRCPGWQRALGARGARGALSRLGATIVTVAIVGLGCASSSFEVRPGAEGWLWHPSEDVGIPDLGQEGWRRVGLGVADLTFHSTRSGAISVRVRCPAPKQAIPLRWEARQLWLGVPRDEIRRFHLDVDGYEGVNMEAESDGLQLRTLVVRTERCSLDVAQVAPLATDAEAVFEDFISRIRLHGGKP